MNGNKKLRDPESQERFDDSFLTRGLTEGECMSKVEELLVACRLEAGELAKTWLVDHGYFNGELESDVYHYADLERVNVQVTLTCYGLPDRTPKADVPVIK